MAIVHEELTVNKRWHERKKLPLFVLRWSARNLDDSGLLPRWLFLGDSGLHQFFQKRPMALIRIGARRGTEQRNGLSFRHQLGQAVDEFFLGFHLLKVTPAKFFPGDACVLLAMKRGVQLLARA